MLQHIFAAVREPTIPLCKTNGYVQFLEGVLTESFLYVLEPSVTIYSRKSDVEVVKTAAANAAKAYKDISGRDIAFTVEGSIADDSFVFFLSLKLSNPHMFVN